MIIRWFVTHAKIINSIITLLYVTHAKNAIKTIINIIACSSLKSYRLLLFTLKKYNAIKWDKMQSKCNSVIKRHEMEYYAIKMQ